MSNHELLKSKVKREFSANVAEIMDAVIGGKDLEGVNILCELRTGEFLFHSSQDPLVEKLSEALNAVAAESAKRSYLKAVAKSTEKADAFAIEMHSIFKSIIIRSGEEGATQQDIANILNRHQIPTVRGGKWAPDNLRKLYKKWDELNLDI